MKQNWWKAASVCLMMSLAGLCLTNCGSDDNGEAGGEVPQTPDNPQPPSLPPLNAFAQAIVDDMVMVTPGTFLIGSPDTDADALPSEKPQHSVTIARYFMIGKFEVTNQLWTDVMGQNAPNNTGPTFPVCMVTYNDIQEFLTKLNEKAGVTFRLPTEEEWEFAARGGQTSTWTYAGSNDADEVAWYGDNSNGRSHSIEETLASKKPNSLGIYNMSGNIEEWTGTVWKSSYDASAVEIPNKYTVRGGEWAHDKIYSRVAERHGHSSTDKFADLGFRIVLGF